MIEVVQQSWGDSDNPIDPAVIWPEMADLSFADPPYNIGVKYADDPTRDRRDPLTYELWAKNTISQMAVATRQGGSVWWMCPEAHGDFIGPLMTKLVGPRMFRIIWYETFAQYQGDRGLTADYRFIFCHQRAAAFGLESRPLTFNPHAIRIPSDRQEKYKDKRANPDGRVPGQVWKIRRLQGTSDDHVDWHKAQLPPELLDRVIKGWSNEGDTILDAFAGSGNMGLSCLRNKRKGVLVDQSPTYCGLIKERLTPFLSVV